MKEIVPHPSDKSKRKVQSSWALGAVPPPYFLFYHERCRRVILCQITSNKERPSIPARALPQPKDDLTNVLDVRCLFRLMCAIPLSHPLAIHRQLDYGVVVAERLPILNGFAFKLVLHRLHDRRQHAPQRPHDLVVFSLTFCLRLFYQLVPLEHFTTSEIHEGLTLGLTSRFNILLEVFASWIVLGYVFQTPISLFLALIIQCLIDEDVRASNVP